MESFMKSHRRGLTMLLLAVVAGCANEVGPENERVVVNVPDRFSYSINNLDEIISLIKRSPDVETARERLMKRYKLTEIQANAILEMQLRLVVFLGRSYQKSRPASLKRPSTPWEVRRPMRMRSR